MTHPTDDDLDPAATRGDDPGTAVRPPADNPDSAAPRHSTLPDAGVAESTSGATDDAPGTSRPVEIGGQKGPEPTRYGDWEKKGRCTDF